MLYGPVCRRTHVMREQTARQSPVLVRQSSAQVGCGLVLMPSLCWRSRHLPEFLTTFGYRGPVLRAVAIDVHFRIEPSRVVKSARFDEHDVGHHGNVREDRRSALGTEVSVDRHLASIPFDASEARVPKQVNEWA